MYNRIIIEQINDNHVLDSLKLWELQLSHFCSKMDMFSYWKNNVADAFNSIKAHAKGGRGEIAKIEDEIVGYLVYDDFNFHGKHSAFVPFIGNAAVTHNRDYIYLSMYRELSKIWVEKGIRSHYLTISTEDVDVKSALFDVGFGSYLIDAFAKPKPKADILSSDIYIEKAELGDLYELYEVVRESEAYYAQPPIFLKREEITVNELSEIIKSGNVFIAKDKGKIVGFINLSVSDSNDILSMSAKGFGQLDEIGAYIGKDYRNKNIGNLLINRVFEYSMENQIPCIHVDFETANMYANKFWRKHFKPGFISLKRTIHSDI